MGNAMCLKDRILGRLKARIKLKEEYGNGKSA